MKRFLLGLLIVFLAAVQALAVESVTQSYVLRRDGYSTHTFVIQTAANGSLTATATSIDIKGEVVLVEIDPGATGPSNGAWDLTLVSEDSVDILGGQATNLSSTVSTAYLPYVSGSAAVTYAYPVNGTLTVDVLENVVDSAQCTVTIFYRRME